MSKVLYGGLFAAVFLALALAPSCKGGKKRTADEEVFWGEEAEAACGCTAESCGCGEGCGCEACGCTVCGPETEPACGCTPEACACGEGCGCGGACGCGEACGAEAEPEAAKTPCGCEAGCGAEPCAACGGCGCEGGEACGCGGDEACGCGGCGCGDVEMISDADARHAMRLYRRYLIWGKANATRRFKSKPHKLMITNYVNKIGQDSWKKGSGGYPAGSSVAKEGWKDDQRAMVFFMEKRAAGFDADNGDWWYATVDGKGKILNAGKVQSCIDCHANASNDYVFGTPK
ncbi:MAG: cytochrome P460 family protein [Planctomycetota bacterium]|jgi:hypothetical protein